MASVLQAVVTTLLTNTQDSTDDVEETSEAGASSNSTPNADGSTPSSSSTAVVPATGSKAIKRKPPPLPNNLAGLIKVLFSMGGMRDWIKLFIIGGFVESFRRLAGILYQKVVESFFLTASFEEGDDAYDWMMVWLSKRPAWSQARDIQVSTRSFGVSSSNRAVLIPGDEDDPSDVFSGSSKRLAYLPSMSTSYTLWHKGHWMQVSRTEKQKTYYSTEEQLSISVFARGHAFLNEILLEAKRDYLAMQEHNISIYVSDSTNGWRYVASRPKRSLKSIILDPGIKDLLVEDARDFLQSKPWYAARGIPFRRGYLLYGAPGSGKTSIIHSMAGELGLDVYIISVSRAGLDDTGLNELISALPEHCIALMEDVDAAFHQVLNRGDLDGEEGDSDDEEEKHKEEPEQQPQQGTRTSRISLSGLLNALDGVGAQEGRILYATTNKYTSLDPALCRPGRMDIHVEFKLASRYQAKELFKTFYLPEAEAERDEAERKEAERKEAERKETEKSEEIKPADSGYGTQSNTTPAGSATDLTSIIPAVVEQANQTDKDKDKDKGKGKADDIDAPAPTSFFGNSHWIRGPKLTSVQVADLAKQFADAIPERQLSMAAIQGFLMGYKIRPHDAIKDVRGWVDKSLADKIKKQKRDQEKEERRKRRAEKKAEEEKKKKEEKKKEEEEKKKKEEEEKKEGKKEEKKEEKQEEKKKDEAESSSS